MRQMKHGCAISVKAVNDGGTIQGYGSVFGNIDAGFDVVEKGAFADTLEENGLPKMLWGHDIWEPPIGKWTDAKEDDHGLLLQGELNLDMQKGAEVYSALKMGTLDGLSIGYRIKQDEIDKNGVRRLQKVDLHEVSVVTFPMNELARVDAVKQLVEDGITKRQLEHVLRDAGFSGRQAKALIADGHHGLIHMRDAGEESDEKELRELISNLSSRMR